MPIVIPEMARLPEGANIGDALRSYVAHCIKLAEANPRYAGFIMRKALATITKWELAINGK